MFYEQLKALCTEKGVSLTNVISELHMSAGNMSKWKNGGIPKSDTLSALSEYFGVTTDYLLGIDTLKEKSLAILDDQGLTLSDDEYKIIVQYRNLDDEGKTMVKSTLITEARRMATAKGESINAG